MISRNKRKFQIEKRDDKWRLLEPGFLHVASHWTNTYEEMLEDFPHFLKVEQAKRRETR